MEPEQLSPEGEDLLFLQARTYHQWLPTPIHPSVLERIYNLMKWGPTSTNCNPFRVVFLTTAASKEKLLPCLMSGNVAQTQQAPVTAIVAYDVEFYKELDILSPANKARTWFEGKADLCFETARLNGTLQGGYFILAARACGLDCGPMSGFDNSKVDKAFFDNTSWRSNFLCNLGYGDTASLYPRGSRLSFTQACILL